MKLKDKIKQAILEAFQKRDPKEDIEDLIRQYNETGDFENIEVASDVAEQYDLEKWKAELGRIALNHANKHHKKHGPEDASRNVVIKSGVPVFVSKYAYFVDKAPREDTRNAVNGSYDGELIYRYAYNLDNKTPRDDTRSAINKCGDAYFIYNYATNMDNFEPRDDTRQSLINTGNAFYILNYSANIDKKPREDIKKAIMKNDDGDFLYDYLEFYREQEIPNDETRNFIIESGDVEFIFWYAVNIDKKPRLDTYKAIEGTQFAQHYINAIGHPEENGEENLNESLNKWQEIIKG